MNKYHLFAAASLVLLMPFLFFGIVPTAYATTNTAPTLDSTKSPVLSTLNEDSGAPSGAVGTLVSSLADLTTPAGGLDNVTDPDASAVTGIAITGNDSASLTCFYSLDGGTTWNPLGAISNTSARLLAADSDNRVYCQPTANYNGTVSDAFTIRAWDQTTGTDGTLVDTSTSGGTSAFSSVTDTIALTVTPVNDAPILDSSKSPIITAVNENAGAPSGAVGTLISALVDSTAVPGGLDNVTDVDTGALLGIAIIGVDSTNLTCYYSESNGGGWSLIGAVSATNALLLASNISDRVYCRPATNFTGMVSDALTIRARDITGGFVDGTYQDASVNGGTTEFSASTDTVSLTVNAVAATTHHNGGAQTISWSDSDASATGGTTGSNSHATTPTGSKNTASGAHAPAATRVHFVKDLHSGMTDDDVVLLQEFLNTNGFAIAVSGNGAPGHETSYFGRLTRLALAKYQAAHGITPASGYFGPLTRGAVNGQ